MPTMRALRKTHASAGLELVDLSMPGTGLADEVLVRVSATGICEAATCTSTTGRQAMHSFRRACL
jgi:D-arabinose 1-dehydrogenase-like Zn-dependent alcohol dehydrogenase